MARSEWAIWLERAMSSAGVDRRGLMDLVGRREDGGFKIDASRLSNWLGGKQGQPSYRNVLLVARALGEPEAEALAAAGFDEDGVAIKKQMPAGDGAVASAFTSMELTPEEQAIVRAFVITLREQRLHA